MIDTIEELWFPRVSALCDTLRETARAALADAFARDDLASVQAALRQGAGDVTYAIDARTETAVDAWFEAAARTAPLSLLTEDSGWRHLGPDARGGTRELADFDHGGPRIALDPIDGTRNIMADLRSAWTVVSFAPAGPCAPRMAEQTLGIVAEIPDSRAARYRVLHARGGSACAFELRELGDRSLLSARTLRSDVDARVDHGYFPFFRYAPDQRPALAALEARFFERLARLEGADVRHCFDDQYISNAGQLALLSTGTYRMIADVRAWLAQRHGASTTTSKPYDVAGAIFCARAAGCVVSAPLGAPSEGALDFPIDCTTPVSFVGFVNTATAERIGPHLDAALRAV